ncbi:MAG: hypothetical protein VXY56_09365, partial [Pseudomonadota bacterium]|nr:hypothetical protein [Pseudomonadota bacterium]
ENHYKKNLQMHGKVYLKRKREIKIHLAPFSPLNQLFGLKQLLSKRVIFPGCTAMEISFVAVCVPMSGITQTMIRVFEFHYMREKKIAESCLG